MLMVIAVMMMLIAVMMMLAGTVIMMILQVCCAENILTNMTFLVFCLSRFICKKKEVPFDKQIFIALYVTQLEWFKITCYIIIIVIIYPLSVLAWIECAVSFLINSYCGFDFVNSSILMSMKIDSNIEFLSCVTFTFSFLTYITRA